MLGRNAGGLEQAAIDYHEALGLAGFDTHSIIHPQAEIRPELSKLNGNIDTCSPLGEWDLAASYKLKSIARNARADLAICHGNRALGLALRGLQATIPVVGVAHNYNVRKRFHKCDAVFSITQDLINEMLDLNISSDRLFHIPNMVRCPDKPLNRKRKTQDNLVIGTMGRFVPKKGFDYFIKSVNELVQKNIPVKAVIGGDGPEKENLEALVASLGLEKHICFLGWVESKEDFFKELDIFVLPSYHEPFGIVLIEAMAAGLPCISTNTEGPSEIINHNENGILVPKADVALMSDAIKTLLEKPQILSELGDLAFKKVKENYDINRVSHRLAGVIKEQFMPIKANMTNYRHVEL